MEEGMKWGWVVDYELRRSECYEVVEKADELVKWSGGDLALVAGGWV